MSVCRQGLLSKCQNRFIPIHDPNFFITRKWIVGTLSELTSVILQIFTIYARIYGGKAGKPHKMNTDYRRDEMYFFVMIHYHSVSNTTKIVSFMRAKRATFISIFCYLYVIACAHKSARLDSLRFDTRVLIWCFYAGTRTLWYNKFQKRNSLRSFSINCDFLGDSFQTL